MPIPASVAALWAEYAATLGGGLDESRFYEAFAFGDSDELAAELAQLVLSGAKRATAGLLWTFESKGKPAPAPGDLSVVTTWAGKPLCIIETLTVDVVPFHAVTAEFAAAEGEGEGSLAFWWRAHREFFTRECARLNRAFSEDMLVACERFRVAYQPAGSAA
jgi:uncharacterized protein YhfF